MTPFDVIDICSWTFHVDGNALMGRVRTPNVVASRQAAMALVYKYFPWSSTEVGSLFDRDHTTVLYARDRVENRNETGDPARELFDIAEEEVKRRLT